MTDLYALLTRAIESQPENTPETRHAVYNHIRGLYERQRQGIDPTLTPEEIQAEQARLVREQASLETVIARIEAERSGALVASDDILAFDRYESPDIENNNQESADTTAAISADLSRERPRIVVRRERRELPSLRRIVVLVAIAFVLAGIGGTAWWLRSNTPATLEADAGVGDASINTTGTEKIAERVNGAVPEDLPQQAQPIQSPQQAAPTNVTITGQSEVLAQRAFLFELNTSNREQPKITAGQVLWRLEGKGSQTAVLYADVTLADAGLSLSFVMRPNDDAALPASHTIEISFVNAANAPDRVVRDIAIPQLRTDKEPRGVPMTGLPIPVADNTFLIGLSNGPADVARNYGLLRERDWIDIPIRFVNGETGTITFAKGSVGQQAIADALDSWR